MTNAIPFLDSKRVTLPYRVLFQGLITAVANLTSSRQSPSSTPLSSTPSHVSGTDTPPRSLKEVIDGGVGWDEEGLELERSKLTLLTPLWEVARAMRDQK